MVLIKNGEIHIGNGEVLNNCDIIMENGKIKEIGCNLSANENCEVIDATNDIIFPGFIDAAQNWGAYGPAWGDDDLSETSSPLTPHLDSIYSFDQDAMNFQRTFEYGVTSFGFVPTFYNVLGGRACAFKTFGNNPYDMLIKKDIAISASVSNSAKAVFRGRGVCPTTKLGITALLKQAFYDAQNFDGEEKDNPKNFYLKKVLNKEIPLLINCSTQAEINCALMLADEFDLDIILIGAYKLSSCNLNNKHLKKVLLGNLTDSMHTKNYEIDINAIKAMRENGTEIAICSSGDSSSGGKEALLWNGILYMQMGFNSEEILQMLTLNPAKILGIESKVGSIEVGKDADIIIWSNNPILRFDAKVKHSFLNGEDLMKLKRRKSCW